MMIYISRDAHFCAAHKLYNEKWSKEKNEEIFGACANENWHGHNFDMTVTVKGQVDPDTGFVMNFKDLNKIIKRNWISQYPHLQNFQQSSKVLFTCFNPFVYNEIREIFIDSF